jgi:peptide/nickel transport system permease protein
MKVVQFVMKRLAFGLGALIAISIAIFVVTQALPADPAKTILGRDATPESLASLREVLGLNKSLLSQYTNWLGEVFRGDFGTSFTTQMSVSSYLGPRFGNSLFLMVIGAVFSIPISILLGALQALKRDTRFDGYCAHSDLCDFCFPMVPGGCLPGRGCPSLE